MEKYSRAVSEMYSQFKRFEDPEPGQYVGRLANYYGEKLGVVGYSREQLMDKPLLIVDASQIGGWSALEPSDVIFKDCESYWYVSIDDLID